MNRISILDCTLRDGGYVNDFRFGRKAISEIIRKLSKASVDIIECGFLRTGAFDPDCTLFGSIEALRNAIGNKNTQLMYVGMIQYGKIGIDEISDYDGTSVDGIRVTFHEHEIEDAFVLGRQLMAKGYLVFMQPVGTTTYTDEALLQLVKKVNELKPYAFYLVDTLGTLYKNDLLRMFYLVDHNLDRGIVIGFHSHNNLQLSFANAQELMQLNTSRRLIIDGSIYGMGRGAGNLNTELATQYINTTFHLQYDNREILEILDEYIRPLRKTCTWGYDAAYYLASVCGCHPNYAAFLLNKQTLHVPDIYAILNALPVEKKILFDKEFIGAEYLRYQSRHIDDRSSLTKIRTMIGGRDILLLAPGKNLGLKKKKVRAMQGSGECFTISINFIPDDLPVDMVFVSNLKRFTQLRETLNSSPAVRAIVTSNITVDNPQFLVVDYSSYLNEEQCISDNAGLMCITLLKRIGAGKVTLAGFDGYSPQDGNHFIDEDLNFNVEAERLQRVNQATREKLKQLGTQLEIDFLTKSVYQS